MEVDAREAWLMLCVAMGTALVTVGASVGLLASDERPDADPETMEITQPIELVAAGRVVATIHPDGRVEVVEPVLAEPVIRVSDTTSCPASGVTVHLPGASHIVCDGAPGPRGPPGVAGTYPLLALAVPAPGAACPGGGFLLLVGSDDGNGTAFADDGSLHADEVDVETTVCDGRDVHGSQGPPGPVGPRGPVGPDGGHGPAGPAGPALLVKTGSASGADCPHGGTQLILGLDNGTGPGMSGNGVLEHEEAGPPAFICHGGPGDPGPDGAAGPDALVRTQALAPDPDDPTGCASGGTRVWYGADDGEPGGIAGDRVLQDAEAEDVVVCNGRDGRAYLIDTAPVNEESCPHGGFAMALGHDADGDGTLDESEATRQNVCDGADGSAGSTGPNGTTALLNATALSGDPDGCLQGGHRLATGLDDGAPDGVAGDGVLQETEEDHVAQLCYSPLQAHEDLHHWIHPYPRAPAQRPISPSVSVGYDLTLGPEGLPVAVFSRGGDLHVAYCLDLECTALDDRVLVSGAVAPDKVAVAVGPDGFLRAAYTSTSGPPQLLACRDPYCTSRVVQTLDASGGTGQGVSLAIGVDGYPVVTYTQVVAGVSNVYVIHCTSSDCAGRDPRRLVDTQPASESSVAVGLDGRPVIVYRDDASSQLRFARCTTSSCAVVSAGTTLNPSLSQLGNIAIGLDGRPVVAFTDQTGGTKLVVCGDTACSSGTQVTTLDALGGGRPHVAVGHDGWPIVAYARGGQLWVSKCLDPACTRQVETSLGVTAGTPIVVVGLDGLPRFLHPDGAGLDLHIARNPYGVPGWWRRG